MRVLQSSASLIRHVYGEIKTTSQNPTLPCPICFGSIFVLCVWGKLKKYAWVASRGRVGLLMTLKSCLRHRNDLSVWR